MGMITLWCRAHDNPLSVEIPVQFLAGVFGCSLYFSCLGRGGEREAGTFLAFCQDGRVRSRYAGKDGV